MPLMRMLSRAVSSGLKPTPSSMNGESRPLTAHVPVSWRIDAGDDLEQRALAAAVRADDPEELARLDAEADVLQRVLLLVLRAAKRVQEVLLQRRPPLVWEPERLRDAADLDRAPALR